MTKKKKKKFYPTVCLKKKQCRLTSKSILIIVTESRFAVVH